MSTSHWYFDIKFSLISWYLYQLGIFTLPALGTPLHWYPLTNAMNKESLLRIPDINFSSISWYQPLFNILISSDQYQSLFDILISTLHWYLGIEHWAHLFINILILSFQYLESGFLISTSHWYLDQLCIDILISTSIDILVSFHYQLWVHPWLLFQPFLRSFASTSPPLISSLYSSTHFLFQFTQTIFLSNSFLSIVLFCPSLLFPSPARHTSNIFIIFPLMLLPNCHFYSLPPHLPPFHFSAISVGGEKFGW